MCLMLPNIRKRVNVAHFICERTGLLKIFKNLPGLIPNIRLELVKNNTYIVTLKGCVGSLPLTLFK